MSLITSPLALDSNRNASSFSFHSKVTTLPKIAHPSALLNEHDMASLDVRGQSKLSGRNSNQRYSSLSNYATPEPIPQHVDVLIGDDRNKVRLPIFGRRPSSTANNGEPSAPMNPNVELAELESILREKVRCQMSDIRAKFRHSIDFDANGKVSLQAFKHILASIFGTQRQISPTQTEKLLQRLHLKELTKISFDDLLRCLSLDRESRSSLRPRQPSPSEDYLTKRTAGQMFLILKEKARTKNEGLVRFCPSLNGGSPSKIFKSQLSDALIDMGYRMKEKEFDKLWNKFDPDGFSVINSEKFLKRLTNEHFLIEPSPSARSETQDQQSAILQAPFLQRSATNENPTEKLDANQISQWFRGTLPQRFEELERSLKDSDPTASGQIPSKTFLRELKRCGLDLEEHLLDFFFQHFNLPFTSTAQTVDYPKILQAFREKIPPPKKDNKSSSSRGPRQTSLEKQVEYLIASNYEQLYEKVASSDRNRDGTIDSQAMRSFVEDLLEFPLRHDEYQQLFEHFPKTDSGKILYRNYFDGVRERLPILQSISEEGHSAKGAQIPQWDYMRSTNIRESLQQESFRERQQRKEKPASEGKTPQHDLRSIEQLHEILKRLIQTRSKEIEGEFRKIDYGSYGELTREYLYRLLKRLAIQPEVTPEEIQLLWSQCHLKENGTLDFEQFFRQFGYSKKSAHYPNARDNPPKKGDGDYLLTSNKLYADSILVHDTTRHAIRANWDKLKQEFAQLDPYRTGFLQQEEFEEILVELCPNINQQDLQLLKNKLGNTQDARIHYVQFLKQYAPNAQSVDEIEPSRKRLSTTISNDSFRVSADRATLKNDLETTLRRKLSYSYKQLRRSFKQEDITNCGSVSIGVFKQVLNEYKCALNDEQFYVLISELDTKMNGTINYNYFLQHYLKNP